MKHIVNFSGGACSFWAAVRTIERYGKDNTVLLFADTLYEHPDLYEFNRRAEAALGLPVTRLTKGMTPWELFAAEGLIGNDRFPICSTKLKRELLNGWMQTNYEMDTQYVSNMFKEQAAVVLGFDWTEGHRVDAFKAQWPHWQVEAPMAEEPLWDKCRMLKECEALGLPTPTLYKLGFPHNNCGGFCVRAGISHFVHLYKVMPEKYAEIEQAELTTQLRLKARGIENWVFTVLKRGGKPFSFKTLREHIEAGKDLPKHEWGGCGCGGATDANQDEQI